MLNWLRSDSFHRRIEGAVIGSLIIAVAPAALRSDLRRDLHLFGGPNGTETDPDALYEYDARISAAWLCLAALSCVLMVAGAFVADVLGGSSARDVALGIFFGLCFFCVTGGVAAALRSLPAWAARRRSRCGNLSPREAHRLLSKARIQNTTLVAQAIVGVLAGVIAAAQF